MERLPVVFTRGEMQRLFEHLDGVYWVICQLLMVVVPRLEAIMKRAKYLHEIDLLEGMGDVAASYFKK